MAISGKLGEAKYGLRRHKASVELVVADRLSATRTHR